MLAFAAPASAQTNLWNATVVVKNHHAVGVGLVGYGSNFPDSTSSVTSFTDASTNYTVREIYSGNPYVDLNLSPNPSESAARNWTLHIGARSIPFSSLNRRTMTYWTWRDSNLWSPANTSFRDGASLSVRISTSTPTPIPATGAPRITGVARVGQTLRAVTTAIMDANGLNNVSYTYRWIRAVNGSDSDIPGAAASAYTLQSADVGNKVKVRVSFTDDQGGGEMLTSDAYPPSGTINEEQTSSVDVPVLPPTSSPTEEEQEEGCAVSGVTDDQSLETFVECAARRIEDSDTFEETLRLLEELRDGEGNWNNGSTYLVLLTARGGVYFHANNREVEDLDWSGVLLCEGGGSVLDTEEGCFVEYEGERRGYAHPLSASHVPLARDEAEFVLLGGGFDEIPRGEPLTGMIGEPSTGAGEVDTDDELKEFVGEAGRVLMVALSDSGIDPAELRGILREKPWREGDVYIYILGETGRVIFDGADRNREQKDEYAKQYVRDLIMEAMEAGEGIVEYTDGDSLRRGYTARVEVLDAVYFVGSGYRVEGQSGGSGDGGGGCAVGGSDKGGAFGLFLAALALLLSVSLKRRPARGPFLGNSH